MCLCGVLLVIQPDFIFLKRHEVVTLTGNNNNTTGFLSQIRNATTVASTQLSFENPSSLTRGILYYSIPVAAGFALTGDVILVKKRSYLIEKITEVLFWNFLSNTVLSIVVMFIVETPVLPSNWYDTIMISLHCFSYVFIWPLYLLSMKYISGNTFVLISSTIVVFMLVAQYTVLSSILPGHRNWMEVLGVVMVLVGSTLEALTELCKYGK